MPFDVDEQVAMIKCNFLVLQAPLPLSTATNELEMAISKDQSYLACFATPTSAARRLPPRRDSPRYGLVSFSIQLYKQAGSSEESTFDFNTVTFARCAYNIECTTCHTSP